jgi:hypothetical protein
MQIRADQMSVFASYAEARFTAQIMEHLCLYQAQYVADLPREELAAKVELFKTRARSYGLTWQSSITGFIALCFAVGPDFDQQPQIHGVLTDESVDPNERVQQLIRRVQDSDWGEASVVS